MSGLRYVADAFGLRWASDRPVPCFADAPNDGRPHDVSVTYRATPSLRAGGMPVNNGELFADGTRFRFEDTVFDMYDGSRIEWHSPGDDTVPMTLGGTVAAHLLAWRGLVPLHGSAVAFGHDAILVAGPSGAGKSTMADALTRCGGRLVSDDLSVMLPPVPGQPPQLVSGRPAIRLARTLGDLNHDDKRLALPPRTPANGRYALSTLLLLTDAPEPSEIGARAALLADQLFRPTWMRMLPHRRERSQALLDAAAQIRVITMPPAPAARGRSPDARAQEALDRWHNKDGPA